MNDTIQLAMNWRSATLLVLSTAILLNLALLWGRGIERASTVWLVAFSGSIIVTSVPYIIGFIGVYDRWPGLSFLPVDLIPLFGPLFYLHAHTLMKAHVPRAKMALLLAPGAFYWLFQVWAFTALDGSSEKFAYAQTIHDSFVSPTMVIVSILLGIAAVVGVWRMKTTYMAWIENQRADGPMFRPVWLVHFLYLAFPLLFVWVLEYGLGLAFSLNYFERFWAYSAILALTHFLTLSAVANVQLPFPKMTDAEPKVPASITEAGRDWAEEGQKLKRLVQDNEWFLEPRFSLDDIARRSGLNQNYASRAINRGLGVSFNHFINEMRVAYAKRLIDAGSNNFLDVALASGFGSKASFNRAFRQHINQTPSHYRSRTYQNVKPT
ncbi:MAG: helix-turn-helix domain-containing protein [Pseudomonadota bacterium]